MPIHCIGSPEEITRQFTDAMNRFFAECLFQDLSPGDLNLLRMFAQTPSDLSDRGKFRAQGLLASLHKKVIAWCEGLLKGPAGEAK